MLLDKLKQKQTESKMTDTAFARQLGVSQQLWNAIKLEQRKIAKPALLTNVLKVYPELTLDVLLFLSDGVVSSTTKVDG